MRSAAETQVPTVTDAFEAALRLTGSRAVAATRFGTGNCHWVFDVRLEHGNPVVIRMTTASMRHAMVGALHLNRMLRPMGVPLPQILCADLESAFPTLLLERFPGTDLGHVMAGIGDSALDAIAERVVDVQRTVSEMPSKGRYGYAVSADKAPFSAWPDVLASSLDRSRRRMRSAGVFSADLADRIEALLGDVSTQASEVHATCFLHDTTTKNVIVTADGRLSGIVDVDDLCWGDPRFTAALTLAAVQAFGGKHRYVATWMQKAGFEDDRLFRVYVVLFVLDFLSEQGNVFNGNEAAAAMERRDHLLDVLENALRAAYLR